MALKRFCTTALIILFCVQIFARDYVISGYIKDKRSGEGLIAASIYDSLSTRGAATNAYGYYSIHLPEGNVILRASYVGYSTFTIYFDLHADTTININLVEGQTLSEVVVSHSRNKEFGVAGTQMSALDIPIETLKLIPSIGGETDIIKAIQLLPGVQSGSEGFTGLYVRGGGPDENLILLDGVPLYNVSHLGGFFSVFNSDAIKNVTLYKGDFPAEYGSRLSSVLDVRQNDGNERKYHGVVSVGLLSAKANIEGPIWKDHTTFNLSFRRTYFDLLLQPILMGMTAQENSMMNAGYYFYDLNARVTHKFSDRDRLTASFYMGDDNIYYYLKYSDLDASAKMRTTMRWGNTLAALNWTHVFNSTTFSTSNVSYTGYRYDVSLGMTQEDPDDDYALKYKIDYLSNIQDINAKYEVDYTPAHNHNLKFGANYIFHIFRPQVNSMLIESPDIPIGTIDSVISRGAVNTHEAAIYASDKWDIHRIFKVNLGVRAALYSVQGRTYPSIEPRVSFRLLITPDLSFKGSYSYASQYVHLLSSSNLTLPTDLWVPVTQNIAPMHAHQVAAGLYYNLLNQVDISVEGYYKQMDNVMEYLEGESFFLSSEEWEKMVGLGKGWSYGVEVMIKRDFGKVRGWIGYTWSRTRRLFDREGMEINFGRPFDAKYDRRHDLSLTIQYIPAKWVELSATFVYGTGTCGTLGTQRGPDGFAIVTARNNVRMPDYHRADIGANFHFKRKINKKTGQPREGEHLLNISIYNLYNHQNPFVIYLDEEVGKTAVKQLSLFPILPSLSYTFKF